MRKLLGLLGLPLLISAACVAEPSEEEAESSDEAALVSSTPGVAVWTRLAGGMDSATPQITGQNVTDVATDDRGWSYLVGSYFTSMNLVGEPFTATGYESFLAAFDGYGKLAWSRKLGTATPMHVAVDALGQVTVAGQCEGSVDIGTGSTACNESFVAAFSTAGAPRWVRALGNGLSSLAAAPDGSLFVTAQTVRDFALGDGTSVPGNAPGCHMNCRPQTVVAALTAEGTPLWSKAWPVFSGGLDHVVATNAGVVFAGSIVGAMDVDHDGTYELNDGDHVRAAAILHFDAKGALLSSRALRGPSSTDFVTIDAVGGRADGEIVLAGAFRGTVDFAGSTLTGKDGGNDLWVLRLRADDSRVWAKRIGGSTSGARTIVGVDVDQDGYTVLTGTFAKSIFIGSSIYAKGERDMFLAKLTPKTGATAWKKGYGAAGSVATPRALVATKDSRILVTGVMTGSIDFGKGSLAAQGEDGFLTRFYP